MASDFGEWLRSLGLGDYLEAFQRDEIDFGVVGDLTDADLRELGLPMGPRKKLLRAAAERCRETAGTAAAGQPLPTPTANLASSGERRQVTVLFSDISGFTRLSSELGAEATHALLSAYFARADAIVESFGGSVDKHIGDSVMAVFGAPTAHSDDPERAVRAALAIQQAMPEVSAAVGRRIEVHIGVANGQVVASGVGQGGAYTVTGSSVNLASRLTDRAAAGTTLLSAGVHESLGAACEVEEVGELTLKGIERPVRAYRLLALPDTADARRDTSFVGRRSELRQFAAALDACEGSDGGQAIYLRGEAGIGKTRLTEEFERSAGERGFTCLRQLILDFGAGKGQDAVRALVRGLLALPSPSARAARQEAAEQAIGSGALAPEQRAFLYDLLDLPLDAAEMALYDAMDNVRRLEGKAETVVALVRAESARRHLLIVVEDVHWADGLVLRHLASLARSISDRPVILVMTSRFEGDRIDDSWRSAVSPTPMTTIDLRPLRSDDALVLASQFFDAASPFARSCIARADGNPLFLEQLLRGVATAAEGDVPASIQSIVQARLDALDPADKLALQAASVLGQRFDLEALRHLVGAPDITCTALTRRYLVRPDVEHFLFSHDLVRQGVYSSLLGTVRRELHRSAAAWYAGRDLCLRAEHLDRAGDDAAPAAYLEAAQAQVATLRFETAASLAGRGKALAEDGETACALGCVLAEALLNTGATEEAAEAYREAVAHATSDALTCRAWTGLAAALRVADRQEPALEALSEAEAAARRSNLTADLAQIHYLRGNVCFPLGRIEQCLAEHSRSLELARTAGSAEAEAKALSGLGDAHYLMGEMGKACDSFRASVALAQEHALKRVEVANRHMVGWSRLHLGEMAAAWEDGKAAADMARQVRHHRAEVLGLMLCGHVNRRLGKLEAAERELIAAVELARRIGAGNFLAQALSEQAMLYRARGRSRDAREMMDEALGLIRTVGRTFCGPLTLACHASLCDDATERRRALQEAETILDEGCVAHNQFWFPETAIADALRRGAWQEAERFAERLERYTRHRSFRRSRLMVEGTASLVAWGRGERHTTLRETLGALEREAAEVGLSAFFATHQEEGSVA